jgi:hypothetical protein
MLWINYLNKQENISMELINYYRMRKIAAGNDSVGDKAGRATVGILGASIGAPVVGTAGFFGGGVGGLMLGGLLDALRRRRGYRIFNASEALGGLGAVVGAGLGGITGAVGGYKAGSKLYGD